LENIETRAMIATLSADRSLVEVAGLRDEATEQGQIAGYGAERITSFGRQSARVTARPAWTGKPRRRRIVSDCRPVAVRAPLALDSPGRRAIGKRSAGDRPYASRPEMAPQVFGKARFAPGNGAPPGPSIRKPAACCLRFAVERPMRVARNSQGGPCGSRASPTDFVPRRRQVEFLIWAARNPLKSPESDEGIQENPSPFSWSGLVWIWFGLEEFGRRLFRRIGTAYP